MVRASIGTGIGILIALLTLTGLASAQGPISFVTGDGGAAAAAEAAGGYHADASGATDAIGDHQDDTQDQLVGQWKASNSEYEQAREDAWNNLDGAEPATPEDLGEDDTFDQLDQVSTVEASHTDKIEKAADVDTEYVDAGADLSATGSMKAWFSDAVSGFKDAYDGLKDKLGFQTQAKEDAKAQAYEALHADDELRGQITDTLAEDHDLPQVDPSASGELSASHATEVASGATGHAQIP